VTTEEARLAVGKCVQERATAKLATIVKVSGRAVLIRYDDGPYHTVGADSLNRRADFDDRTIPRRRWRRAS